MKWIRHYNETTLHNYEMKFIRFPIFMKEFMALLKNEILPRELVILSGLKKTESQTWERNG